jgi:branched-chain amino acid aminotransferase
VHELINFNGRLIEADALLVNGQNRSLRFGDGLFETMFWNGSDIRNIDYHLDRLFRGLGILGFNTRDGFTTGFISREIRLLCEKNTGGTRARVRLTVFRKAGPLLMPSDDHPEFFVETSGLPEYREHELRMGLYTEEKKSTGVLSNLKTNNFLLYVMARRFAHEQGWDDALILNSRDRICEACSSNVFGIKDNIVYTPSLKEGCVAGTRRRELLERIPSLGLTCRETEISPDMMMDMEEIFLTNAVRGMQAVSWYCGKTYGQKTVSQMIKELGEDGF